MKATILFLAMIVSATRIASAQQSSTIPGEPKQSGGNNWMEVDKMKAQAQLDSQREQYALINGRIAGRQTNIASWQQALDNLQAKNSGKIDSALAAADNATTLQKLAAAADNEKRISELKARIAAAQRALEDDKTKLEETNTAISQTIAHITDLNRLLGLDNLDGLLPKKNNPDDDPDRSNLRPNEPTDRPTDNMRPTDNCPPMRGGKPGGC